MTYRRQRLRSKTVVLGGIGVLAVALTSCSDEADRRCVDEDSFDAMKGYKVLADSKCEGSSTHSYLTDPEWYYDSDSEDGWADSGTFDRGGFGGSGTGTTGG